MKLIGLAGRAQHGKDTVAKHLQATFGFTPVSFAVNLKLLLALLNPIIDAEPEIDAGAGLVGVGHHLSALLGIHPFQLASMVDRGDIESVAAVFEEAKKQPEVRRLLQDLGVGARRVLGPDVWVRALERRLPLEQRPHTFDRTDRFVVTDVRFCNEADWVREMGGEVWLVVRVDQEQRPYEAIDPNHESEVEVFRVPFDRLLVARDGEVDYLKDLAEKSAQAFLKASPSETYMRDVC